MKVGSLSTTIAILLMAASTAFCAVLGIDYGEEYTKASLVAPGVPFEIVMTDDSKRKDMSGISFKKVSDKEVERAYGNAAGALWSRFPESSTFYFKPLLGVSPDDEAVKSFQTRQAAPQIVASNNNRSTVAYSIHDEVYPVEEILGMTFSKIKDRAADLLAANSGSGYVKDASVTVPNHYTLEQRLAVQDAVEISGLKLISLVNDGVAVAVNFASKQEFGDKKQYHIIYDVGAGSTAATLVSFRQGEIDDGSRVSRTGTIIEVEGVGYDTELGGHALTSIVRDLLVGKFLEQNPKLKKADLMKDYRALNKLWTTADKAKTVLSANSETKASIETLHKDTDFSTKISRAEFEAQCAKYRKQVTQPITDALTQPLSGEKSVALDQVESIILTGGSVRVPFIKEELQTLVGDKVPLAKNVNADEAAVLGATLRGVGISKIFKSKEMYVVDRSIWDYDLEMNGKSQTLFGRGTPLGTIKKLPLNVTDDFSLDISENGRKVVQLAGNRVAKAIEDIKKDVKRTCVDEIVVEGEFTLTHSRTVDLSNVYAKCMAKEVASSTSSTSSTSTTSSSSNSEVEAEEPTEEPTEAESETATESSTTTTTAAETTSTATEPKEKPAKPFKKTISIKSKYFGSRPMGVASKQGSASRLRSMDRADNEREAKAEARNTLEGAIYRAKEFLSDLEEGAEQAMEKLQEEFGDWLDFEGENANLKELVEKQKALATFRKSYDTSEPETATSTTTTTTSTTTTNTKAKATESGLDLETALNEMYKQLGKIKEVIAEAGVDVDGPIAAQFDSIEKYVQEGQKEEADMAERVVAGEKELEAAGSDKTKTKAAQAKLDTLKRQQKEQREQRLGEMSDMVEKAKSQVAGKPTATPTDIVHEDL